MEIKKMDVSAALERARLLKQRLSASIIPIERNVPIPAKDSNLDNKDSNPYLQKYGNNKDPFFDPRLSKTKFTKKNTTKQTTSKTFNFNEPGQHLKSADQLRSNQLASRFRGDAAVKSSMARFAVLDKVLHSKDNDMEIERDMDNNIKTENEVQIQVEWWDLPFVKNNDYSNIDFTPITNKVFYPDPIPPSMQAIQDSKTIIPPLMLTKAERKKARRIRRVEEQREKQERIKLGLDKPEESRVKITNMMKVLSAAATSDPSIVEARVKAEMTKRQLTHELTNQKRKLTSQQKAEKGRKKYKPEIDDESFFFTHIYRCYNLDNVKNRFKIEANANQFQLFGFGVITPIENTNIVIVQGAEKGLDKFNSLMLRRISWEKVNPSGSNCELLWKGSSSFSLRTNYKIFHFEVAPSEQSAKEYFNDRDMGAFWDIIQNNKVMSQ